MQAVPESRQQTFEELYGPPENFLEIEVRDFFSLHLTLWLSISRLLVETGPVLNNTFVHYSIYTGSQSSDPRNLP